MRVLIIDNNIDPADWGARALRWLTQQAPGMEKSTLFVRRAPQEDLPADPRRFDRILVSGSRTRALEDAPWIERLLAFVRETIDAGIPYLGVCYGHQMLVRALGGKETLAVSRQPEYGWTEIELTEAGAASRLTAGLPSRFHSFSSHQDEVTHLPSGMRRLASSQACEIQALELTGKPAYGIQFHPERTAEDAELAFARWRKAGEPAQRQPLASGQSQRLYDIRIGDTLIRNFMEKLA